MTTITRPSRDCGKARSFPAGLGWSVLSAAGVGASIGYIVSWALPILSSAGRPGLEMLSLETLGAVIPWFIYSSWFFIPLGIAEGLVVGLIAGLAYPLTLRAGKWGAVVSYAISSGAVAFAIWFTQTGLPNALLDYVSQEEVARSLINATIMGITIAAASALTARFIIYRPLFMA